ncbi:hypothetical protein NKI12_21235 [Mesorhizobium australicum]|uniref:Uncharacterized protein n=1 Tax=Mesorhizobium australicum TaxID=536018 RepID=A0ACC6T2R4_9HYPH
MSLPAGIILPDAAALLQAAVVRAVIGRLPDSERDLHSPAALIAFAELYGAIAPALWQQCRSDQRNSAVLALVEWGFSPAEIEKAMSDYEANEWIRDRLSRACPDRYVGKPAMWLWLAFQTIPAPLKKRRILQVIAGAQ